MNPELLGSTFSIQVGSGRNRLHFMTRHKRSNRSP
jgi:hypothetical protein